MNATSLNVSKKVFTQLSNASKTFRISKRELVSKIFLYCHKNMNFNSFEIGKLTKYQIIADGDEWKCMRIDFTDTQTDVFFFYRNRFRISLSKLLSVGFVLFFDEIIKELSGEFEVKSEVLNCLFNSYTEIKQFLYNFVRDAFKYFEIQYQNTE